VFRNTIWEALTFIVGVLVVSVVLGWVSWNVLGFLTADAVFVKMKPMKNIWHDSPRSRNA
jgi:hypothetical protein